MRRRESGIPSPLQLNGVRVYGPLLTLRVSPGYLFRDLKPPPFLRKKDYYNDSIKVVDLLWSPTESPVVFLSLRDLSFGCTSSLSFFGSDLLRCVEGPSWQPEMSRPDDVQRNIDQIRVEVTQIKWRFPYQDLLFQLISSKDFLNPSPVKVFLRVFEVDFDFYSHAGSCFFFVPMGLILYFVQ